MLKNQKNYAFIDSQNLNLGTQMLGWKIDYKKFRFYLKEKHSVQKAYVFIGYVSTNQKLYTNLEKYGYILIFKPTTRDNNGKIKGNVDAELVLQSAAIDFKNYDKAVIVSGDGDFYCLVDFLFKNKKFLKLIAPNRNRFSSLFKKKKEWNKYIIFINESKKLLEYKKRLK